MAKFQQEFGKDGYQTVFATRTYGFFKENKNISIADEIAADRKYFHEDHKLPVTVAVVETPAKTEGAPAFVDPNADFYQCSGIPQFVVIDRNGIIRFVQVGFGKTAETELHKTVKSLLAEPSGTSASAR